MKFINGYKSWFGLGGGALTAALMLFGVISPDHAALGGTVFGSLFGAGIVHKFTKGQKLMTEIILAVRDKGAIVLAVLFSAALLLPAAPAAAKDCNFESGLNARLVRVAWPPSIGFNALGFVDVEFGISGMTSLCGNATANVLGGICLLPQFRALIPLCPKDEEVAEEVE